MAEAHLPPAAVGASGERPVVLPELLSALNAGRRPHACVRHLETLPFGPGMRVERFELGNGLKVLIQQDREAPVVSLHTWFGVGSRHEKVGKTGLAHLFEHLMFGETEEYAHGAFDRLLEEAGAETNAATFLDWTYYHASLPTEALPLALRLEAARLEKLILREEPVAREREVVANERRQRVDDDVDGAVSELLYRAAFREHAYGWPTIGWMEDIQGFTTDDCLAFYRTFYAPNNATLVLVGDVDFGVGLRQVQDTFGALEPSVLPLEDVHPEPPQTEERRLQTEQPTPTHKLAIGYRGPALGDFDYPPLVLLNELLFGGRASRIHRALVQTSESASEVRGWVGTFRDPGLYDLFLSAREGIDGKALLAELDAELDRVRLEGVTQAELDRAKARLELATLQGLETVSGRAEQLGFHEVVLGRPTALFDFLEAYRRATVGDLLRVARRYLVPSSRTVVEVLPSEEDEEDEDEAVSSSSSDALAEEETA